LIAVPFNGIHGVGGRFFGPDGEGYIVPSDKDLAGVRELDSAQLVKFREPLGTWLAFVRSLAERQSDTHQTANGSLVILSQHLTAAERERFDRQIYERTPKGRQAVEAIVKAIGEQLKSG
jgi:hypothetical protein